METRLELEIRAQPDDTTCGPTCLHALYRYYGDDMRLAQLIEEVRTLATGGTLAVCLARHALLRGYRATIFTYNLTMFDPTWFATPNVDLASKLRAQLEAKQDPQLEVPTRFYLEFLELGGEVRYEDLSPALIRRFLRRDRPILTGLSATYLYHSARELGLKKIVSDDVRGYAAGHFVVLSGYDPPTRTVLVADPLQDNPRFGSHYYEVNMDRVLGSILLGIVTNDANLLILEPPEGRQGKGKASPKGKGGDPKKRDKASDR